MKVMKMMKIKNKINLFNKISSRSFFAIVLLAAVSSVFDRREFPVAVLLGGIVGILHLKGVSMTADTLVKGVKSKGILWFFSILRLMAVTVILFLLVRDLGVNPLGLLAGLVTVHVFTLAEGWLDAKKQ